MTVVIPTRNRLRLLQQAVDSVRRQAGTRCQIVVVDEASTDGTSEWLRSSEAADITVVHNAKPRRLPGARNAGLELVNTEWVGFLDDDDLWAPDKIVRQLNALRASPNASWCCTGHVTTDENLNVLDYIPPPAASIIGSELLTKNLIPGGGSGTLVRTAALKRIGGFDRDLVASEDWECWLRLLQEYGPPAIAEGGLVAYRWSPTSMSTDVTRMATSFEQVRERHPLPDDARLVRLAGERRLRYLAFQYARARNRKSAMAMLRQPAAGSGRRALYTWVAVTGREWPSRRWRLNAHRDEVARANEWLHPHR